MEDMEKKNPNEQHIRFRSIIEILGKPKEHIEKALKNFIELIKKDDNFMILKEDYEDTKPHGDVFSAFVELEIVSRSLSAMVGFCFDYMPSTMEIIKPDEIKLKMQDMTTMLLDLQGRLHKVDMVAKQLKFENDFLRKNMNVIIQNLVMLLLKSKNLGPAELSKFTGINEKEIEKFLENMIKENKIKKEEGLYSLVRKP